jgi:hypothetical protein
MDYKYHREETRDKRRKGIGGMREERIGKEEDTTSQREFP